MRSQLNDTQSSQAHAHTQGRVMCQKYVLSTIFTLKPESTVFKEMTNTFRNHVALAGSQECRWSLLFVLFVIVVDTRA